MKVEFNTRGDLVIKPENPTERFALQAWADGKQAGKIAGCFVIDVTPAPVPASPPTDPKYVKEF